jgi:hypothetical protein
VKRTWWILAATAVLLADVSSADPPTNSSPLWYVAVVPLAILIFAFNRYLARRRRRKGTFR